MAAQGNTAIGDGAMANVNPGSSAFGQNSIASGLNSTAVGAQAMATGTNSTAIGYGAVASGTNSMALGAGAVASAPNSVAVGDNSVANRPNTFSVGSGTLDRDITNVGPGIFPTDAVNVSQLQAVQNSVNHTRNEECGGLAAVAAMPPMITPTLPGKFTVAVGTGGFQGQWGVGVTATYRLPLATPAYVGASYGNGGGNENVWRVMGAVEF
jgi:trimeric autotransporter adhesin